ncbi:hypothetical protein ACHAL6_05025 [Proteiniclasticum sp. C24MP]
MEENGGKTGNIDVYKKISHKYSLEIKGLSSLQGIKNIEKYC